LRQPARQFTKPQIQAALGALVGAAVGDALGAPFEFQPAGTFSTRFPQPVFGGNAEMIGGGSFDWAPGEFTDDTQLALALAESLVANECSFDPELTWTHFTAWSHRATDVGITTSTALSQSDWRTAAEDAHRLLGRTASNGSVMRIAPIGILGARLSTVDTVELACAQSALTHFDSRAGWAAAMAAELISRLIHGYDFDAMLATLPALVDDEHRDLFACLLSPTWEPRMANGQSNGSATICLAQAVWAVRTSSSFEQAVTAAIDLGDDADTVGAVTGALAGARYGIQAIPSRWTTPLNGVVAQTDGTVRRYRCHDLQAVAHRLIGKPSRPETPPEPACGPQMVHDLGVHAANLAGAIESAPHYAVVSLCRTRYSFESRSHHREIYMIDEPGDENPSLHLAVDDAVRAVEAFLAEGKEVIVHCHGGRSRTGLVLKAWYMRRHDTSHDETHDWLESEWSLYSTWNARFGAFLDDEWMVK
jgi:ADP-ribosyl-[dinitrogen reductase] hydrolase